VWVGTATSTPCAPAIPEPSGEEAGQPLAPAADERWPVIVDTSAWVEYLRATESAAHRLLREAVSSDAPIATPSPVVMELLAGCRTEEAVGRLQRMLARFEIVDVEGLADFEDAACIQRTCRRGGESVRSMIDCLIAAVALREARPLLTTDRDFDVIARHVGLRLVGSAGG
jgi:predicted nucleic acid-binding protein